MIIYHIESDETSSREILHNLCGKNVQTGAMMWHPDCVHLSYMPYLLIIAKRICTATGYTFDFSQWEMSPKRHLLVCNVMPESLVMHNFSYPLPHWTVSEFFENIEFLLGGRFSIDSEAMHIAFNTDAKLIEDAGTVYLSQVVDEFDATVELNPEKEQRPEFMRNRGYESNSGRFWDVRCCDWYIRRRITGAPDPDTASGTAPS